MSTEFTQQIIATLPCGVIVIDANMRITLWNAWVVDKSDVGAGDATGKDLFEIFPELRESPLFDAVENALKQGLPCVLNRTFHKSAMRAMLTALRSNKKEDQLNITVAPIGAKLDRACMITLMDVSGAVRRENSLAAQIAERKQQEAVLRQSEQRLRDFANAASDWLWETDTQHRFTFFSERFNQVLGDVQHRALGKTREEMICRTEGCGQTCAGANRCIFDQQAWDDHLQCQAEHRPFRNLEYPLKDGFGNIRFVRVSGVPVFEENIFKGYRGTASDITDSRKITQELDATRNILHTLVDNAPVKIHIKDEDGKYILSNPVVADLLGTTTDAMKGRKISDFLPASSGVDYDLHDRMVLKSGQAVTQEEIFYQGGDAQTYLTAKFPMRDIDGNITAVGAVGVDITALKRVQREALSQSLLFQSLLDNAPFMVHIKRFDGEYTHINQYSRAMFGLGERNIAGCTANDLFGKEIADQFNTHDGRLNKDHDQEIRLHRYKIRGEEKVFLVTKFYQYDPDGKPCAIVSIGTDVSNEITARQDAEKSRALLMDAINSLSQGFVVYDSQERLVLWNKKFEELYSDIVDAFKPGVTFEELSWKLIERGLVDVDGSPEAWALDRLERFRKHETGIELYHTTGQWVLHDDYPTSDGGIVGTRTDITQLKERERELELSKKRLMDAQAIAKVGSWEWNVKDNQMIWSDEMYRICGYEPGEITPTYDLYLALLDPQEREDIESSTSTLTGIQRSDVRQETRLILRDGSTKWAAIEYKVSEVNGVVVGLRGTLQDITHQKLLESQLMQATQMSALGETAAGLAHEMSQPLAVTRFAVEGLMRRIASGVAETSFIVSRLETIDQQMERMGKLIDQIRVFIRNEEHRKEPFVALRSVQQVFDMMAHKISPVKIDIVSDGTVDQLFLYGSPLKFEQVLINLLNNAAQAISTAKESGSLYGDGKIVIKLHRHEQAFVVDVIDNAGGIPAAHIDHLFDPFYTTKPAGEGTGLGLSICRQIVKNMNGKIAVMNVNEGACFTVQIPVHESGHEVHEVHDYESSSLHENPIVTNQLRRSTILVVEDEPELRNQLSDFFKDNGMDVFMASSAEQGRAIFSNHRIDLVVTDLHMPGIGGRQLVSELRDESQSLPIIVLTGHSGIDRDGVERMVRGASCVLSKPVKPADIWLKVCELLNADVSPHVERRETVAS